MKTKEIPKVEVPKVKDDPKKKDEPKKKAEATDPLRFQQLLQDGQRALQAKKYDDAVKSFTDAQKLMPDDARVAQFLKQAQKALNDSKTADPKKKMSWLIPDTSPSRQMAVLLPSTYGLAGRTTRINWFDKFRIDAMAS